MNVIMVCILFINNNRYLRFINESAGMLNFSLVNRITLIPGCLFENKER